MRATDEDRKRLQAELDNVVQQLRTMGARKVVLFGSLARGELSLFSDIDLLVLFPDNRSSHELGREIYRNLQTTEAVDVLAYSLRSWEKLKDRPFFRHVLSYGKVLYEAEADCREGN